MSLEGGFDEVEEFFRAEANSFSNCSIRANAAASCLSSSATRSASRARRGFSAWARSSRRTIPEITVSSPTRLTVISRGLSTLTLPPITSSPGPRGRGRLSPVNSDSSIELRPAATTPSAGTDSPGRTRTRSPAASSATATSSSAPSSPSRVAVAGSSRTRASAAWPARWRAPISR